MNENEKSLRRTTVLSDGQPAVLRALPHVCALGHFPNSARRKVVRPP
jgi:hypothetical protein